MQEFITAFGVDWQLIVIQIFNFAILLAALWYFLYRPVLKLLTDRQQKIERGVRDAEEAARKLAEAEDEKGNIMRAAHEEAEQIVARAKSHAVEKSGEILTDAQDKSARTLADAQAKATEAAERIRKESEDEIAKVAVLAAEKVLRAEMQKKAG